MKDMYKSKEVYVKSLRKIRKFPYLREVIKRIFQK